MSYNSYANMSTAMKDHMVNGTDLQQQIVKYNNTKENVENVRTPKRHHSGEQGTNIDDNTIMLIDDGFRMVTRQRAKQQRINMDDVDQEQSDVIYKNDELNRPPQQEQYIQKRKTTTASRTFVNNEMITAAAAARAMNNDLRVRELRRNDKQINKSTYPMHQFDNNYHYNNHQNQQENKVDHQHKFHISNHALHYAVEQHLPPIKIKCDPKITDQKYATTLITELFSTIETNFRKLNTKYIKPLGFDYWYIDRDGHLQCYTKEIELFVFLFDTKNYPAKLSNTTIDPNPPKRLPPQRSVILKHVPKDFVIEDIKNEISNKYESIFNIEEMRGTINGRNRHIRIDLTAHDEYMRMLNGGVLVIGGQLFEVSEFLAPPRLLICSRCNTPGHIKKTCKGDFDRCRRCGGDKGQGEHKECLINCHHCNGEHESTSYICPLITNFRKELIIKLKTRPNLLPYNVQLFIPTEYRAHGEKNNRILTNNTNDAHRQRQQQQQVLSYHHNEWPSISNKVNTTSSNAWNSSALNENNIWNTMIKTQNDFDVLKAKFDKQQNDLLSKYNENKFKLGSILSLISVQVQQQNETVKSVLVTVNELVPIIKMSLEACQKLSIKTASNANDQLEKLSFEAVAQQMQTSITFLNEQNQLISNKHAQLLENFEVNIQLLQRGVELFISSSE